MSQTSTLRAYYFASYASMGIFLPFASPWLYAMGMTGAAMGMISAMRPFAGVIAPVMFGWLADTLGLRGGILRVACLGTFLPFAVISALAFDGVKLTWLSLLVAIGLSSFFRVPMGTLADVTALENRNSYGSLRLWGSVGFVVAALIAGKIMDPTQATAFPVAVALTSLLSLGLSFRFPSRVDVPRRPSRADVIELLRRPSFSSLLLTATIWCCAHNAYDLCISLHLKDLGAAPFTTSVAWTIGASAEIVLMASWTKLKGSRSTEKWLRIGLAATALRFMLIATVTRLEVALWLQPLHALSFALVWMAMMDSVRQRAPEGMLGTAQGLFSTACSIGATVGMLGFGPLYDHLRGRATFAVAAIVALLSLIATWLSQPAVNHEQRALHT